MSELILFDTALYRRDALELTARQYQDRARVELADSEGQVAVRFEALGPDERGALRDEFCNQAFSETARRMRDLASAGGRGDAAATEEAPWALLEPFGAGATLGLGWVLESLTPVRGGAANLVLRHQHNGNAQVAIRRNSGAPLGVAHTDQLDFLLMNGGGGSAETDGALGRVLRHLAATLGAHPERVPPEILSALLPHAEGHASPSQSPADSAARQNLSSRHVVPQINAEQQSVSFEFEEGGISRLALFDAVLGFADRCFVYLTRGEDKRLLLRLKTRKPVALDELRLITRDVTKTLNQVTRNAVAGSAAQSPDQHSGLPSLPPPVVDLPALLRELEAADPATVGLGFRPDRGPGHENLRVLNIRGTGACNSDCVFCVEKFNPTHRAMPKADATRQLIVDSGGRFDMLFFASGEPTIHPRLFDYVELARSVGFTRFGMSSHFRTFADPSFALKILQAGFEYFDISLHAADADTQLQVNPIGDDGNSLFEALKGLAVLTRLAAALGIRISVTQKIVVSRLNVTSLEPIFRKTYDRGVRHFILQPVRTLGLAPELQAMLAITEEEIRPHLNELLRHTEGLGALLKPYGFARQHLYSGPHVESEQNRVKNIYGKARRPLQLRGVPSSSEERPTDGRHWVEVRLLPGEQFAFASDGQSPVLDDALERGLELPFGCRMGSCGMCSAHLIEGKVDQSDQIFLNDEQIGRGLVLMCQARPLSDVVLQICSDDEIDEL